MRLAVLAAALLLPLGGCISITEVRVSGGPAQVQFGRVRVEGATAVSASTRTLGAAACSGFILGLGWQSCTEVWLNPNTCGLGIVYADKAAKGFIAQIADHVRAECPTKEPVK